MGNSIMARNEEMKKQTQQRQEHKRDTTEVEAQKTPHSKTKQETKREDERNKKDTTKSERQNNPTSRAN